MTTDQPVPSDSAARPVVRLGAAAGGLALFSAAMWLAWLGWDQEYYVVDGVSQGPYRAWQVLGCGISVAVGAVLALVWVRGRGAAASRAATVAAVPVLSAAAILGFAVPWAVHAASTDDSGLWVVGVFFLLVGGGFGMMLLLSVTAAVTGRRRGGTRG